MRQDQQAREINIFGRCLQSNFMRFKVRNCLISLRYLNQVMKHEVIMINQSKVGLEVPSQGEECKEELQGLYNNTPKQQLQKKLKSSIAPPSTFSFNNILLVIIVALLFAFIVVATNEHYSRKIEKLIGSKDASITPSQPLLKMALKDEALQNKLQDISSNELKIIAKLNEMTKRIDHLDQTSLNIVQSDTATDQQLSFNNDLKNEVVSLSKELNAIKSHLATTTITIQKENAHTSSELTILKELIIKDLEQPERPPKPILLPKVSEGRQFEADFLIENTEDPVQQRFSRSSEKLVDDKYILDIPKKMWIFEEPKQSYMHELIYANNLHFAKQSRFEVAIVNRTNFRTHLSLKTGENIQKILSMLEKRAKGNDPTNIKYHLASIIKNLILFNLISENGGVMVNGQFAMTEDFKWISQIIRNPYVNRGNRGVKPQIVGFYSLDYTSDKVKEKIKPFPGMHPVDKYMSLFPAMENYFIAAEKKTPFMAKLLVRIAKLLTNPQHFKRQKGHYRLNNLKGEDIYYQYFLIAVQTVLQDKQKEIDMANIDQYRHFAIDYYGLNLINCYYAPYKLKSFWGDGQSHKAYESLTQYTAQELEANIGPMRYIAKITPVGEMNGYLEETKNGRRKFILDGSFIQKIFFPNRKAPFIRKADQQHFTNITNEPWLALPKIIWVFWDKGLQQAGINNQLCVQNLRNMGKLSGFEVKQVNNSNAHNYLDSETLLRINSSLKNAKLKTYPQSRGDLIRLALLAKYGGIYMDASFFALESFDWLVNIGRYPSQYIFNRFGHLPKVVMMFHPHWGAPFQWSISQKYNIKTQWHLAYENNFIAAQKGSELIADWFELLLSLYVKPYSEVEKVFQDCMMYSHKWSTSNWHYLIPMDAIKCVVGGKQVSLKREGNKQYAGGSDYYKFWSLSGYLGQQKLRSNTNFQNPGSQDNKFVYRYSQEYVQGLIGKIRHVAKFYSQANKELSIFVSYHMDGDFSNEVHPDSLFNRYIWSSKYKLYEFNSAIRFKIQQ